MSSQVPTFIFMGVLTCAWAPQIRNYAKHWHNAGSRRAKAQPGTVTVFRSEMIDDDRSDDRALYVASLYRPLLSNVFFVDRPVFVPDGKPEGSPAVEIDSLAPLRLVVLERCDANVEVGADKLAIIEKFGASQKVDRLDSGGAVFALIVERDICNIGFCWVGPNV